MLRDYWNYFLLVTLAAFVLRLFFYFRFPHVTGDSLIYGDIARNWLQHGIYGLSHAEGPLPTWIRLPGYPAFLAACFLLFGSETRGLGRTILGSGIGPAYRIPIFEPAVRSLNLSNAVSIVVYEALRQLGRLDQP